jgi:hypothetical protein
MARKSWTLLTDLPWVSAALPELRHETRRLIIASCG